MAQADLPTFLAIGPGRSGTTWMYEVLRAHPEVCTAHGTKETFYFDEEYHRGLEWYKRFFRNCSGEIARGEVSNTYIFSEEAPKRIRATIPDVTLISCLRNPIERFQSLYLLRKRNGKVRSSLEIACEEQPDLISTNRYGVHLERYLDYFDESQVRILFYDDLQQDPRAFAEDLYRIIGVDPQFSPELVEQTVNAAAEPRIPGTGYAMKRMGILLRSAGLHGVLDRVKSSNTVRSALFRTLPARQKDIIPDELRKDLLSEFASDVEKIEALTGRELNEWKK